MASPTRLRKLALFTTLSLLAVALTWHLPRVDVSDISTAASPPGSRGTHTDSAGHGFRPPDLGGHPPAPATTRDDSAVNTIAVGEKFMDPKEYSPATGTCDEVIYTGCKGSGR